MEARSRSVELFGGLAREHAAGAFHAASSDPGQQQLCSYASAHHALALRHIDAAAAAQELRTLYAACQAENGLVGAAPVGEEPGFLVPPVAAYATARLVLASELGPADLLERAVLQLDAIWGERLPSDTDLPVILHPAESGTPASPGYDGVIEWTDADERSAELETVARSAAACRFDPDRALRAGHAFVVEDPVFCGWFLLALEEAQRAVEKLGDATTAQKLSIRAGMIAEGIAGRLWCEQEQIFAARDRQRDELLPVVTAGGLVPAASRILLEEGKARGAAARHLAPATSALFGTYGISFNPIVRDRTGGPVFAPWRGNASSALTAWWSHLVLLRTGRPSDAALVREKLEGRIEEHGHREIYDALTGEPGGTSDCALPALVLEMEASESE